LRGRAVLLQRNRLRQAQREQRHHRERQHAAQHEYRSPTEQGHKLACQQSAKRQANRDTRGHQDHEAPLRYRRRKVRDERDRKRDAAAETQPGQKPNAGQLHRRVDKSREQREDAEHRHAADQHGSSTCPIAERPRAGRSKQQPDIAGRQRLSEH